MSESLATATRSKSFPNASRTNSSTRQIHQNSFALKRRVKVIWRGTSHPFEEFRGGSILGAPNCSFPITSWGSRYLAPSVIC